MGNFLLSQRALLQGFKLAYIIIISYVGVYLLILTLSFAYEKYFDLDASAIILKDGQTVGGDFIAFYAAGKIIKEDPGRLYDLKYQKKTQEEIKRDIRTKVGFLPFAYLPLVAAIFIPFSHFPLLHAYYLWVICSFLLFLSSLILVSSASSVFRKLSIVEKVFLFILCLGFEPFLMDCLAGGQTSCLGLFLMSLTYYLMKKRQDYLAGMAFSMSYYKPHLFVIFLIFLFLLKKWRMLKGFLLMGAIFVLLSLCLVGFQGISSYYEVVFEFDKFVDFAKVLPTGEILRRIKVGGLSLFLHNLLPNHSTLAMGLSFCSSVFFCSLLYLSFIRRGFLKDKECIQLDIAFSLLVCCSLFFSPRLLTYDLTIMLVPLFLLWPYFWKFAREFMNNYEFIIALLLTALFYCEFLFREFLFLNRVINFNVVIIFLWIMCLLYVYRNSNFKLKRKF